MGSPPLVTPHSLRDALRSAANGLDASAASSGTTSEEDWDELSAAGSPVAVVATGAKKTTKTTSSSLRRELPVLKIGAGEKESQASGGRGIVLSSDDTAVRDMLQQAKASSSSSLSSWGKADGTARRGKFSDLVFTRTFSAFDRQNHAAANSPFHGFFTLFWMSVFFFVLKIGADNWKQYGSPLGNNEIMEAMFRRDLLVLLISDGVMSGMTGVSWLLQRAIKAGYMDWDRSGWVLQNLWQTAFIGAVVGLTLLRDWPWTHTVFFVMHGLVMVMKQHSYAFYNGYLSSAHKKRLLLLAKLKQLEKVSPIQSPSQTEPPVSAISTSHLAHVPSAYEYKKERRRSTSHERGAVPDTDRIAAAIGSGEPLDEEQVQVFERILKWEVDALSDELRGKSSTAARSYPNNLSLVNHYEFIVLPTLVYELEYPRSDSINWYYAAEKMVACFGVIFVMIMVSQAFILPVVMDAVRMKEAGMPLAARFAHFPGMFLELIFPFMMEYLLTWYLIWETILNFLAELTYFADRSFYDAWWNSVSWDQFARDWNRPVHNFLLRHVYHSSISAMKVDKHTATLITFFLSACVHELVMWCIFKKLRGYLLILQMCQLPLVRLSRTKWLRHRATLGNMIFWLGIFTGPSVLCSLYLIL
ncbi:MBOAT family protein [Podospora didyma]|uniref:MBOAT family protein n=1 Tax=Podospora didyma TaxID=330526 RepID=A0AAE0P8P2_9PEZI|nr:MBOAT family protein [Podospora didyma]